MTIVFTLLCDNSVCIAMWLLATYSNSFEIVSTVAFLLSRTRGMYVYVYLKLFNTISLYTISNGYTR